MNTSISNPTHAKPAKSIVLVSLYEVIKGVLALLVALLVAIWHDKLPDIGERLTHELHHVFGHLFVNQINNINHFIDMANQHWQKMFWTIVGYAMLRFIEAYGLYRDKNWAYWLSVLGYGIFLPIEFYYLIAKPFDWVHLGVFLLNVTIVIVIYVNIRKKGLI